MIIVLGRKLVFIGISTMFDGSGVPTKVFLKYKSRAKIFGAK